MKIKYARLNCGDYIIVNDDGSTTQLTSDNFNAHVDQLKKNDPNLTLDQAPKTGLLISRNPNEKYAC